VDEEFMQTFRFEVLLTVSGGGSQAPLGNGAFAECSGLELEADVKEYLEGGFNDGVVRRVGRVKLQPLVLKRGMMVLAKGQYADITFWDWLTRMVSGTLPVWRCDGHIRVCTDLTNTRVVADWSFIRGLPLKVTGPALNAKTGEVAIEELHIAHEGLRLVKKQ
jgi:phage tail-like protein